MDYRDVVIEDLAREVEDLKTEIREIQTWRTLTQEALTHVSALTQRVLRLNATVRRFMAITSGTDAQLQDELSSPSPPPSDLSQFPTDTSPFVSVHEIRWKL